MKNHSQHMDRLQELAKRVDAAKAASEETNQFLKRSQRAIEEAHRQARVLDTEAGAARGQAARPVKKRR